MRSIGRMLQTLRAREDRRAKKASRFNHGPAPGGGVYVRNRKPGRVPCGRVEFSSVYRVTLRLNTQIRRYHSASRAAKVPPKLTLSLTG